MKKCVSKFVLCPGGDAPWSFRFYEVLMCKSIPIVESWHHTYRTKEESKINYKYLLLENIENDINYKKHEDDSRNAILFYEVGDGIKYDDYVNENTKIFEKYHLLQ